ncbi:MAG: hypothetical protein VX899_00110 [Myxococcota bacterium]|nr:hypothetical protein [Myxococcota bacterium]
MPLLIALSTLAAAGTLDDYKDQKHGDREKVTKDTCESAYIKECRAECEPGDRECLQECKIEAPQFCEERQARKRKKTAGVVAKGGSVAAGGVAVVGINKVNEKHGVPDTRESDEYTIRYWGPDMILEGGGGVINGGVGALTANAQVRFGPVGAGIMNSTLSDGEDWLAETDVGPSVTIASPMLMYTAQPSLLVSQGNDVQTEYGAGVRSYTTLHAGQLMLHFDPMLGYINRQWNYHLRVGASYRVNPTLYARLSYDYRDIVDLNDLNISQARLQGLVFTLGGRFN